MYFAVLLNSHNEFVEPKRKMLDNGRATHYRTGQPMNTNKLIALKIVALTLPMLLWPMVGTLTAQEQKLPSLDQALKISQATGRPILAMAGRNT